MRNVPRDSGSLAGLRVVEVATGVAGPYAGRVFAMLGATVLKVEPSAGDPARGLHIDAEPTGGTSPAFVHLNAGKRMARQDAISVSEALRWADVLLSDHTRAGFGPWEAVDDLVDPPLLVSVTAWGIDVDDPGDPADEMIVQSVSGLLAATGQDGEQPWRFPGWQSQYLAGAHAAAAAIAGLGTARHVEITWVGAAQAGIEAQAAAVLYAATSDTPDDPREEQKHAGFQTRTFPSGVFACADGHVVPGTVRGKDWMLQCALYGREDLLRERRFSWSRRWHNRAALRAEITDWYLARTKREIFDAALETGWSAGMVLTAQDILTDRHLAARGLLGAVTGAAAGRTIIRGWRVAGLAEPTSVRLGGHGEDDEWFSPTTPRRGPTPRPPRLDRLRVLELTWAWSGPFVGRFLGSFGADVVKVETGRYPDGWRTRLRRSDAGGAVSPDHDPDEYTWDAAAQFNSLNRGKSAISVDLSAPDGTAVFRNLLAEADVLVVNMNHRMLVDRGVDGYVRDQARRGLVVVNMPALGASGPDRAMPGFGMLTEGMGGFAARFGPPDEGARTSPTYYPDAVAGVHATVAVLAALAGRSVSGCGAEIDFSQQDSLWLQFGEGVVLSSQQGRSPERVGNTEPGAAASGVLRTADGHVTFVLAESALLPRLRALTEGHVDLESWAAVMDRKRAVHALQHSGAKAEVLRDIRSLYDTGQLAEDGMLEEIEHPVAGKRAYLNIPVRVDGVPVRTTGPAPMFDQHTDKILRDWIGLAQEEITELRASKAIGTRPAQPEAS